MKFSATNTGKTVLLLIAGLAGTAAAAKLTLDAPGHVYTVRERATARGGAPGAAWSLVDWRGRPVATGAFAADGTADLGTRPTGYYHVRAAAGAEATFAVVPVPEGRPRERETFYGVDSAQSWVSRPGGFTCPWAGGDTFRVVSDLLWRTGLPHVRERLAAGEVNPRPGVYDFKQYMYNAELLHARGIRISGMFHDVPNYMERIQKLPRNLAALYTFCRDTAAAFGDRMDDWEFWNEQDITFAPEPAWDYAAALKAAYLGFKAARPEMPVLHGAVCQGARNAYDFALYANDAAKYSDVFNLHTYAPLCQYPAFFDDLRAFLDKVGIGDRAVWMTENGTNLEGHSTGDGVFKGVKAHSPEQELVHAEAYAKSQILFQMQGVARSYFFVFGAYNERDGAKDWGVMRRDGTVKPTYAAMSALMDALGCARLEGELNVGAGARAFLFAQPDGTQTIAFWRLSAADTKGGGVTSTPEGAAPLALPIPAIGAYTLTDLCGARRAVTTNVVTATRYPAYLSGLRGLRLKADVAAHPRGRATPYVPAADEDLSIVLRVDLNTNDFQVAGRKSSAELAADTGRLRLHVWNLATTPKRGTLVVQGGALTGLPAEILLPPMGEAAFDCALTPECAIDKPVVFTGLFDGKRTSRLALNVRSLKALTDACRKIELRNWRDPKAWSRNTSADSFTATWDEAEQAMRFDMVWTKPADRWFYPVYTLKPSEESFDGALLFALDVKSAQNKVENDFETANLMLVYADGKRPDLFLPYPHPLGAWETRRVELNTSTSVPLRALRLGANPRGTRCTYWIRNPHLLKPKP